MSVFDFPRIHICGTQLINPGTANNNSASPGTELAVTSDTESVQPMTRTRRTDEEFRTWITSLDQNKLLRCQWNYYGDFAFRFMDVRVRSVQFGYDNIVTDPAEEPLIGGQVYLNNAIMIDANPEGFHTTQIFSESLEIRAPGALGGTGTFVSRKPTQATTCWLNWYRNVSYHGLFGLPPVGVDDKLSSGGAGGASATFQCAIKVRREDLNPERGADLNEVLHKLLAKDESKAVTALAERLRERRSRGLILHFNLYLCFPSLSDTELAVRFAQGEQVENPARGQLVGTIAPWFEGEPAAVPIGRFLKPAAPYVNPYRPKTRYYLSPVVARYDKEDRQISLDLANCLPEDGPDGSKYNLGSVFLGLRKACDPNQSPTTNLNPVIRIAEISNDRDTYLATGGIWDVSCGRLDDTQLQLLEDSGYELVLETSGTGVLLYETEYMVVPSCECNYLDELPPDQTWDDADVRERLDNQYFPELQGRVELWIRRRGRVPRGKISIKVEQWRETPTGDPDQEGVYHYPLLLDSETIILRNGRGSYRFRPSGSGLRLYRLVPMGIWPQKMNPEDLAVLEFQEFYISLRVLPYNNYSHIADAQLTFELIYKEIFRYYSLILPAMNKRLLMSDPTIWETPTAAHYVLRMIQPKLWNSYNYMPRTRDLSKYRRKLLERFCQSVLKKYDARAPGL
jgi:hypothetical protein